MEGGKKMESGERAWALESERLSLDPISHQWEPWASH